MVIIVQVQAQAQAAVTSEKLKRENGRERIYTNSAHVNKSNNTVSEILLSLYSKKIREKSQGTTSRMR